MNPRFVAIVATVAFLAGCNTMHGVGEDINAGGRKVEDVLKKDKRQATRTSVQLRLRARHQRVERG